MCALGFAQHTAGSPSATCAIGLLTHKQTTQAPRVPTWFFFNSDNIFLKFINDDNNTNSSNF
jgi:hypothetical protein